MALKFFDNVRHLIPSTGDGPVTFGLSPSSWRGLGDAGAADTDSFGYRIDMGADWELGISTISGSVTTGSRTVVASSNGGSALDLDGSAQMTCVLLADQFASIFASLAGIATNLAEIQPVCVTFEFDNGASPLTTSMRADFVIPFNMTITEWTLLLDVSGTVSIDLWQDTYANFPPANADSITNSNNPATSSAVKNQGNASGWTTADLIAGRTLRAAIETVTGSPTRATLALKCTRALS